MASSNSRMGPIAAAAAVTTALVVTLATGCGGSSSQPGSPAAASPADAPVTSTTKIAGAGVLGNQRRPDESCAPDPAPLDDPPTREVRHAAGTTDVPPDPQRIAVLSVDQLDALCALGLQSRIVVAASRDGATGQPSYLGAVIHAVPVAGDGSAPDLGAVKAATPDLILGSAALTPEAYGELSAIAPTVFTGAPGPGWQDTLRTVGAATGRAGAANQLVDDFRERAADKVGADEDATHYQVSVVQLTENTLRIFGVDDFPATVLGAVGADRPAAQRFKDKPYEEVGITGSTKSTDFSAADGDVVFLSFDSPAAKARAPEFLESEAWKKLSAVRDNRAYVVNDEVWQTGEGIVAARGILADLTVVNAPIN